MDSLYKVENGNLEGSAGLYFSLRCRWRRFRTAPYRRLLTKIHRHLKPRTYLEIGINNGDSLVLGDRSEISIGIDPNPRIEVIMPRCARIYKTTSDAFFAERNLTAELGEKPLDLAFIDGMHLFEFALRDFINLERYCNRQSTILFHDTFPVDRPMATRERGTTLWTGDVWKVILCLKKYRPDLKIRTVDVGPTGLTIVRGIDSNSNVLSSRLAEIEREFIAKDFDEIESEKDSKLNRMDNNWHDIEKFLSAS